MLYLSTFKVDEALPPRDPYKGSGSKMILFLSNDGNYRCGRYDFDREVFYIEDEKEDTLYVVIRPADVFHWSLLPELPKDHPIYPGIAAMNSSF